MQKALLINSSGNKLQLTGSILIKTHLLYLFLLLITIAFVKVFNNNAITSVYCLILIALIYFKFSIILGLAFSLLYASDPGGLFEPFTFGLDIGPVVVDFNPLLAITLFLKTRNYKKQYKHPLKLFMGIYVIILFLNFINGYLVGLNGSLTFIRYVKAAMPLLIIPAFIKSIKTRDDLKTIYYTITPFIFLGFFSQLYVIYTGRILSVDLFGAKEFGYEVVLNASIDSKDELSRFLFNVPLLFFGLIFSLWFKSKQNSKIINLYLNTIIFISLFSVVMSGYRTYSIVFFLIFFMYSLFKLSNIFNFIKVSGTSLVLIIILAVFVPNINKQLTLGIERLFTLESFAKGDITADGTAKRFDERAPKLMKAFEECNPIFGAGFSHFFYENGDGHVGYHNLLLNSGYIGLITILSLFVAIIIQSAVKVLLLKYYSNESRKDFFRLMIIVTIGLLILNTSIGIISYTATSFTPVFGILLAIYGIEYSQRTNPNKQNV